MNTSKITKTALIAATALIFGYIESLFPPPVAIPGVKLGISNIAVLFALLCIGKREAFFIVIIKVLVSSLLWSGASSFIYSLSGGILSLILMMSFKTCFSTVGLSILGAIAHNIGQLAASAVMLSSLSVFYYLPALLISGALVGTATGIACKIIIPRLEKTGFC